jgi:hypothetical protein
MYQKEIDIESERDACVQKLLPVVLPVRRTRLDGKRKLFPGALWGENRIQS